MRTVHDLPLIEGMAVLPVAVGRPEWCVTGLIANGTIIGPAGPARPDFRRVFLAGFPTSSPQTHSQPVSGLD